MRSLYRLGDVERRLGKLPAKEHEHLRATYQRMLDKGPERFQVKPSGVPAMDQLYDDLPNFGPVLDDVKRQLALCHDRRDPLGDRARQPVAQGRLLGLQGRAHDGFIHR